MSYLVLVPHPNAKLSKIKAVHELRLVSLTSRDRTAFKIFEEINVISLCWFAAQQQISTFTRQKCDLFYPKFSAKFNELSLKKCLKLT